jgi:ABC-type Fe3+/spermidine/putrescine transport system ATPase subunit
LAVIRPEALQAGPPTANGLSASVRDVSYQGIRYRVALQLDGESGATLVASLPDSVPSLDVGGSVSVSCEPEAVHVVAPLTHEHSISLQEA